MSMRAFLPDDFDMLSGTEQHKAIKAAKEQTFVDSAESVQRARLQTY